MPTQFAWDAHKDFWQQEQGILAYPILYGATGDSHYLDLARESSAFWNLLFLDRERQGYFFRTTENGLPILEGQYEMKSSHAIGGYVRCESPSGGAQPAARPRGGRDGRPRRRPASRVGGPRSGSPWRTARGSARFGLAMVPIARNIPEYWLANGPAVLYGRFVGREENDMQITLAVNGLQHALEIEPQVLLVDLLRERLKMTGTKVGCDTSQCGSCVVTLDGISVKSCTVLAAQADGAEVGTVEGLATNGQLDPLQQGFWQEHGLQCGFCTPGMLMSMSDLLSHHNADPPPSQIRAWLDGNLCRCTGYQNCVRAVQHAARIMNGPVTS